MRFLKGFLIGIPVGIYFGEKNLDFPFTYVQRRERDFGYLKIDFLFMNEIMKDIQRMVKPK